ncbi:MAG: RDD family protein [Bacteriovoracia bacterium]
MEKNTQPDIRFRPITEGLGLNHFADGLPYEKPAAKPMVRFANPPPYPPRRANIEEKNNLEAQSVEKAEEIESVQENTFMYANPFRRAIAFFLDLAIVCSLYTLVLWISFVANGFEFQMTRSNMNLWLQVVPALSLFFFVFFTGYFLVQETVWKKTIGKSLFGLQIQSDSAGAVVARFVSFLLAASPLGIGLLWCFFDSKKRCWHDSISNTSVISVSLRG